MRNAQISKGTLKFIQSNAIKVQDQDQLWMQYFRYDDYMPSGKYEAVVIGSGFGGTIISLSLANKYEKEGQGKKACILERGQWWISDEIPFNKEGTIDHKSTIREYLVENKIPYGVFPYPDNHQGLLKVLGNSRVRLTR